MSHSYLVNL